MRQRGYNKMSLCYDFQKWTILTLALVAISLTVGLIQYAQGYQMLSTNGTRYNCEENEKGIAVCSPLASNDYKRHSVIENQTLIDKASDKDL
jgi:hypothetical protein